jgi:enoyl-CoA hydratase/carnithine racemase
MADLADRDDRDGRPSITVAAVGDGVALVTVDHPPANSLTLGMRRALSETWASLQADPDVLAVVVTGAAGRFFCSGLDFDELYSWHQRGTADQRRHDIDQLVWDPLSAGLYKPVVAAINGYCLAGGFLLAQMCDVRIADEDSEFGIPEVNWNHPAVFAWMTARHLHVNHVLELVLWARRRLTAQRMYEMGFVNFVSPPGQALPVALDWAREVASLPAEAVAAHKRLIYESMVLRDAAATQATSEQLVAHLHDMPEGAELIARFLARRLHS